MIRTAVLACNGATNASLGVTLDVLAAANRIAAELHRPPDARFAFEVLSLRRTIVTSTGTRLQADSTISSWRGRADVILVAGHLPQAQHLGVVSGTEL